MLAVIAAFGMIVLQRYHFINQDVAFLVWTADQVTGAPVYGRDILDVSPPLCILIYMPAVLLAQAVGFEWGIRIWMLVIVVSSVVTLWQTADPSVRKPVAVVFLAFILFAYPNNYAQREQLTLLLCAPYVAGAARSKGWAAASGVMAGVGFLMKPYFLIPLALVFAVRRRVGIEERAIIATGIAYAVTIAVFFQPYVFDMVPKAAATYWAITYPDLLMRQAIVVAVPTAILAAFGATQRNALPYLMAVAGFTASALLQQKGFYYHFIPSQGFLAMLTVVMIEDRRRLVSILAAALLAVQSVYHAGVAVTWLRFYDAEKPFLSDLKAEIDSSSSYATLTVAPAGSQLIATPSRFVGIAIAQIFVPAVAAQRSGIAAAEPDRAERLALTQAVTEISRKPDLVIVDRRNFDDGYFDILGLYMKDEAFRALWKDYRKTRTIGAVDIFRRIQN